MWGPRRAQLGLSFTSYKLHDFGPILGPPILFLGCPEVRTTQLTGQWKAAILSYAYPGGHGHTAGTRAGRSNESTNSLPLGISSVCHPPTHPVPPGDHVLFVSTSLTSALSAEQDHQHSQLQQATIPCTLPGVPGGELLLEAACEQFGGKSHKENLLDGKG